MPKELKVRLPLANDIGMVADMPTIDSANDRLLASATSSLLVMSR